MKKYEKYENRAESMISYQKYEVWRLCLRTTIENLQQKGTYEPQFLSLNILGFQQLRVYLAREKLIPSSRIHVDLYESDCVQSGPPPTSSGCREVRPGRKVVAAGTQNPYKTHNQVSPRVSNHAKSC